MYTIRVVAGSVAAVVFFFSITSLFGQEEAEPGIDFLVVRGNPTLRQAFSTHAPYSETLHDSAERQFRERWIDMQVDHFVRQVHEKLSALRSTVEEAKERQVSARDQGARKSPETIAEWKTALRRVEEQSKGLRTLLAGPLFEMRARDKFQIKATGESAAASFSAETALLFEQLTNAEQCIRDYFFKPTHTASISELKGANMLDYLKRVETIARVIRERL